MRLRAQSCIIALVLAGVSAPSVRAQGAMRSGILEYVVRGTYKGLAMQPWESELSMRDTTLAGTPAQRVTYITKRRDPDLTFTYTALRQSVAPGKVIAKWIYPGAVQSVCTLSLEKGSISGELSPGGKLYKVGVAGEALPDFAVGAYFTARRLADGSTVRLKTFRCLPSLGPRAIVTYDFVASVRRTQMRRRPGAPLEAIWIVQGNESYPLTLWIAESDRLLLQTRMPEGRVGETLESFARTRTK